jgi:hypothetical protein
MEMAIKYTESMNTFVTVLLATAGVKNVEHKPGRRFDRVAVNGTVKYFVDRHTWEVFGAKSSFQYNPRRQYGKLDTVSQFDWVTNTPIAGTEAEKTFTAREDEIQKQYKPRGRPRKNPVAP